MNKNLILYASIFWILDTILAIISYYFIVLMILEPLFGNLPAHRIAMTLRIVIIMAFSFFLLRKVETYKIKDLTYLGIFWFSLELIWEWGGSLIIGRSVEDILIGWNIFEGYIWILVLLSYLLGPYIVGKHIIGVYFDKKNEVVFSTT